ncbi:DUF4971 domain-containing protein [Wocania ichthyoenteri]|uniref:DUF4971 domain-containing protein n=1 Tax=Wocania ichthyoenteri TaxID=1230531 RepID=UPI0006924386|nr:DUF4971 domain-containing protein [Wocania ichthyoenteri]
MKKYKTIMFLLLLIIGLVNVNCSDNLNEETPENKLISFSIQANDKSYTAVIDTNDKKVSIGGIEYTSDIIGVKYKLSEGATISPDPKTRIEAWGKEEKFTITSSNGNSVIYTVLLTDHKGQASEVIVFEDNFDGNSLNTSNWNIVNSGSSAWNNTAINDPLVVEVSNGTLKLKGIKNPNFTGKLQDVESIDRSSVWTGAIDSSHKFDFTYGEVEIRARIQQVPRAWPAIWLHPTDNVYGSNPNSGEIDMVESLNYDSFFYSTIHTEYHWANNRQYSNDPERYTTKAVNLTNWNIYKVEWTENKIDFILNGLVYHTFNRGNNDTVSGYLRWPFDKDFHIILSQQIGGSWVDAEANSSNWVLKESNLPVVMEIDYVKVIQK